MKKTPLIFIGIILLCSSLRVHSQEFFKKIDKSKIKTQNFTQFNNKKSPTKYKSLSFKIDDFRDYVGSASKEKVINIPTPDNSYSKFLIKETSNFHPKLAEKYPMIKSYTAQGIDDPNATLSMSDGAGGIHITVSSPDKETYFIDTASKNSTGSSRKAILYKKNDLPPNKNSFSCQVEATMGKSAAQKKSTQTSNDGKLRTFRMALACTQKFGNFVIDTYNYEKASIFLKKALILSAMNTTMTRVNGIYRKELGVQMQLVEKNDSLIEVLLDPSYKDFFDDTDNKKLVVKNQKICDQIIGPDNYDIGHLFGYDWVSSGLAPGLVCDNSTKALGVSKPTYLGETFNINVVAHEIGHQFGANHTFGNKSKEKNKPTAVEPGSGSTIMGYAGSSIPNIQEDPDAYFHAVSIAEMLEHIKTDATCASIIDFYNGAPTADAGKDYTIPAGTPFVLRGIATDADDDFPIPMPLKSYLTHAWEQTDPGFTITGSPVATNSEGPLFRSLKPTSSPNRYMPALDTVVEGATSMWEVLPTVARDLNFSYTVRDNHFSAGRTARDDMKVSTIEGSPFKVTSPDESTSYYIGQTIPVTWEVGLTDRYRINCQKVTIKLSRDGGITFPIILKENTPNDGFETVVISKNFGKIFKAKIMVEAADNIFYNINKGFFMVGPSQEPTFTMINTSGPQSFCDASVSYTLKFDFFKKYSTPVTLSAKGNPEGSSISFSRETISTTGEVTMTIHKIPTLYFDYHTITVTGVSKDKDEVTTKEIEIPFIFNDYSDLLDMEVFLISPIDNSKERLKNETLVWSNVDSQTTNYDVYISKDSKFTNRAKVYKNVTGNVLVLKDLYPNTTYYWKVKARNSCRKGDFSKTFTFKTGARKGVPPPYCIPSFSDTPLYEDFISNVSFFSLKNRIKNNTYYKEGYQDFTNMSTNLERGKDYKISVDSGTTEDDNHGVVFIDWNKDGVFEDTERYYLEDEFRGENTLSRTIKIPDDAQVGMTRMRVVFDTNKERASTPCNNITSKREGQIHDYTIFVEAPVPVPVTYCEPNTEATKYLYMKNVSFNTINNDKKRDLIFLFPIYQLGYQDFTHLSTEVSRSHEYKMEVTFEKSWQLVFPSESKKGTCSVFIDWNKDKVFQEAERVFFDAPKKQEDSGFFLLEGTIKVPDIATLGATRMRVVLHEGVTDSAEACGSDDNSPNSHTEDYTIVVKKYCQPNFTSGEEYISKVTLHPLESDLAILYNESSNDATDGYQDFTEISTGLEIGETCLLRVDFNTGGAMDACKVFIDWDSDGDFEGPEKTDVLVIKLLEDNDYAAFTYITVPDDAQIGPTRMRVVIENTENEFSLGSETCNYEYRSGGGEIEDYTIEVNVPDPYDPYCSSDRNKKLNNNYLSEVSFAHIKNKMDDAYEKGYQHFTNDTVILGRGDVMHINVYMNKNLEDTSNFSSDQATVFVDWNQDEKFEYSEKVGGLSQKFAVIQAPDDAPLGPTRMRLVFRENNLHKETIEACNETDPESSGQTDDYTLLVDSYPGSLFESSPEYISKVTLRALNNENILNNESGNDTTDGYQDFTSIRTKLARGESYPISVVFNTDGAQDACAVFIDWNGNKNFNDEGEKIYLGNYFGGIKTLTKEFKVPEDAILGETRMRVVIQYFENESSASNVKSSSVERSLHYGEMEDYTIVVVDYCDSKFSENSHVSEFITKVKFSGIETVSSGIDNVSGKSEIGYQDFTKISTEVAKEESYPIEVTFDAVGFSDHCTVYIDWNGDRDFSDPGEKIYLGKGSGGINTLKENIKVPEDAILGATRMRVMIHYFPYEDPCYMGRWGETEDYTIVVVEKKYCESKFYENKYPSEYITGVKFPDIETVSSRIDNVSGKSEIGYEDFTKISTEVAIGESYPIEVLFNDSGFQEHCTVYIDWNGDRDFIDPGEKIFLGKGSGRGLSTLRKNIKVPENAILGATRMRVMLHYFPSEDPCYKGYFGETEDYTIVVVAANSAKKSTIPDGAKTVIDTAIKTSVNEVPFDGFNLSPNPSSGAFNLTFQVINTEKVTVQLFDLSGRLLGERKYLNTKNNFSENIFFESTSAGVYLLKVSNGNKQAIRKLIIK
jgi:hypothetical protein